MDSTSTLPESTGSSDKNTEEKEFYVPLEFSDKDFHSEQTMDRESVLERIENELSGSFYITPRIPRFKSGELFDQRDPKFKQEILHLIVGYLQSEGYTASMLTICDEANLKLNEHVTRTARIKRVKKAVLDGDWIEVEKLCNRQTFKNYRPLLYAAYKQQYLELIEKGEYQKAFSHLGKRLKPLENMKTNANEFSELCYLLSCRSISESPAFRDWEGVVCAREKLAELFQQILDSEAASSSSMSMAVNQLMSFASTLSGQQSSNSTSPASISTLSSPSTRLVQLLQQAVTYQVEFCRYPPKSNPIIRTLLDDYESLILPNRNLASFEQSSVKFSINSNLTSADASLAQLSSSSSETQEHSSSTSSVLTTSDLKCFAFSGESGDLLLAGGSGQSLSVWSVESAWILKQHRIQTDRRQRRAKASNSTSSFFSSSPSSASSASSAAQLSSIHQFKTSITDLSFLAVSSSHDSRIWDVDTTRDGNYAVTASGDGSLRLFDLASFRERNQRNLIDLREAIQHWEDENAERSHCFEESTNAFTSSGRSKLALWSSIPSSHSDSAISLGSQSFQYRAKFNEDSSSSPCDIYCAAFHPGGKHVVGAGFDKRIRVWDVETGALLQTLTGHQGSISSMAFSPLGNLLFTGGKDGAIRVWDLLSGISLKTVTSHLAEVTSLQVDEKAQYLLSASKDNSNRLWDIRTGRSVQRYKGHLNTSKNFIGCCFGSNQKFVAGGSEDGKVYLWDTQSGHQLSRLSGHSAVTFDVKWNSNQGLLASCSQDGSVKLWWFDPQRPKWHK